MVVLQLVVFEFFRSLKTALFCDRKCSDPFISLARIAFYGFFDFFEGLRSMQGVFLQLWSVHRYLKISKFAKKNTVYSYSYFLWKVAVHRTPGLPPG